MDLDGLKIKPSKGKLAVRFLEDEDDDGEPAQPTYQAPSNAPAPPDPDRNKLCLALVLAVGKEVDAKAGQMVAVRHWAREYGEKLELDDTVVFIDSYEVVCAVTTA